MKKLCFSFGVLATFFLAVAQDSAGIYKSKCASCHGPKGAGRPAMKGSNLLTPEAKKATDDALIDAIQNGGAAKKASHAYSKKGVTADQAKGLVIHIRELQK
jgi:mono/diheme cytochrome c family protein